MFNFQALTLHALLLITDGRNISMQGIPSLLAARKRPFFSQPTAHTAPGKWTDIFLVPYHQSRRGL